MSFKEFLANEPIIVVEDNAELLATLKDLLGDFEVPVLTYTDPRVALSEMRTKTPSVVFSDINMEGMNGIELSREIRKILPQVPIVLLTGFGTKEVAVQALSIGVNDLLDKPVDATKLLQVAEKFLTIRKDYLERERQELEVILDSFVEEGLELMRGIDELLMRLSESTLDTVVVDNLFRKIHSIKGASGAVPFTALLGKLSHAFESALDMVRKGQLMPNEAQVDLFLACADMVVKLLHEVKNRREPIAELLPAADKFIEELKNIKSLENPNAGVTSARKTAPTGGAPIPASETEDLGVLVSHQKLDVFLKLSGEMTMVRNYFQLLTRDAKAHNDPEILFRKSEEMLRGFNKITESLQKQIMDVRQVQFQEVFAKLPRVVRSAAQECGKKIRVTTLGGNLGVDKNIAKDLAVVLSHMVRNSVDHGVESPQGRSAAQKPIEGQLVVETSIAGGIIQVEVRDDGAGIHPDRIFAKAVEKGLLESSQRAALSDSEIFQMIFMPGFSTAAKVTSISGRGVGMDVVKNLVSAHHGKIEIQSKPGLGSTFRLLIPVPKSVMVENTILVRYEDLRFVVPQTDIMHIFKVEDLVTQQVSGLRYFQFKGTTIPLLTFDELFMRRLNLQKEDIRPMSVLVLQHADTCFGLLVTSTEGQLDAVILPFDGLIGRIAGFKGTTLLGSDGIAYVISAQQMVDLLKKYHNNLEAVA